MSVPRVRRAASPVASALRVVCGHLWEGLVSLGAVAAGASFPPPSSYGPPPGAGEADERALWEQVATPEMLHLLATPPADLFPRAVSPESADGRRTDDRP
jgi:hypothetical protein